MFTEKKCSLCKQIKPLADFNLCRAAVDGRFSYCRSCSRQKDRERYATDRAKERIRNKKYREQNKERLKQSRKVRDAANLSKLAAAKLKYLTENSHYYLYLGAKNRANKAGIPFNIEPEDIIIPAICPVLGLELTRNRGRVGPNSPSVDKIIPELGYVKGNVRVISYRANTLKSNGTIEEFYKVIEDLKRIRAQPMLDNAP